jgi:hypothetical protein
MNQAFILQNQALYFFGKNKEWVDGYDASALYKTPHRDEAVNLMVEITAKDYQQRIKVLCCDLDDKALPMIAGDIMPAPLPKMPKPPRAAAGQKTDIFDAGEPTSSCSATPNLEPAIQASIT